MTVQNYIRMYRINRYRIVHNGKYLYDSTLTSYECPPFVTESIVMDTRTSRYGTTIIEI